MNIYIVDENKAPSFKYLQRVLTRSADIQNWSQQLQLAINGIIHSSKDFVTNFENTVNHATATDIGICGLIMS